ncbi:hypothetical protein K470DRAFT_256404 [Piedraia hortae CBS 480.64]|uniref:Chloride channel protein n=1 Tax=Piedraia hortae CBS 480.64 TaxID=1314780 RepID=A0A6A7C3M7_9PEZI|nr:hypothetical protein K470DRAFT_256404 [Piedraia hortae CBS 480.64]
MPRSIRSHYSVASSRGEDERNEQDNEAEASRNTYFNALRSRTAPASPTENKAQGRRRPSELDLRGRLPDRLAVDERTGLLQSSDALHSGYRTLPPSAVGTPRPGLTRHSSHVSTRTLRMRTTHSRRSSVASKVVRALGTDANQTDPNDVDSIKPSMLLDDRVWYDQFTSTDWVRDSIADAYRVKKLRSRGGFRGQAWLLFDAAQGWIIVAMIGILTAGLAYLIDITEETMFDYKTGYCKDGWWKHKKACCRGTSSCDNWAPWSRFLDQHGSDAWWANYFSYIVWVVVLSIAACLITLQTKTSVSSAISLSTLDENLGAESGENGDKQRLSNLSPGRRFEEAARRPPVVYYPAAGSGVAEVKVILSGFVLHGYLGVKTLFCKSVGLILSVASGLSLGKEGPYVHIATCIGNICCRMFDKYRLNDGKRREVLSAAAAAGVAVAFGAPIGGVLFSLEEVSYYFPPKTLFRTFFCCIVAALSLKALNPYNTGKIVLFQVRYLLDWQFFEIIAFVLLGVLGGLTGAMFIKASAIWAKTFRKINVIKRYPIAEVVLVAIVTGFVSYWNRYTRLPVAELLFELAAPCDAFTSTGSSLCPTRERIPDIIRYLGSAFVVKTLLTIVTFGIKLPAGIYVPTMVIGGLMGRIVGHGVQWLTLTYPDFGLFADCPKGGSEESCVVPGVYALVAAGATMCGVTRLSVTLAVILFELTGSLDHVLPFSLGVLIAKWTADAVEPNSIYDMLTDMNSYPFLDYKARPIFTTDLGDLTQAPTRNRYIDISSSPLVPAKELRGKLQYLHMAGELDGGLPIVRDGILVGLIPAPDLEFALDRVEDEDLALCVMDPRSNTNPNNTMEREFHDVEASVGDLAADVQRLLHSTSSSYDATDFTPYIDSSPVSLDISSPLDLVFEIFVKLGLRHLCVLRDGQFAGMVHKKALVRYIKEVESKESE